MIASVAALACGVSTAPGETASVAETRIEEGDGQVRIPGSPLLVRPRVQAVDQSGDPIRQEGLQVAWQVVSGEGSLEGPETATDAAGQAAAVWRLGSSLGDQALEVSIGGTAPIAFTARAVELGPIAFASDRAGRPANDQHIFVMQPDGTDVVQLTSGLVRQFGPQWSPDGAGIDFEQFFQGGNGSDIVTLRVTIPELTVGSFLSAEGEGLDWAQDGSRFAIIFWSAGTHCSKRDLIVSPADGSNRKPLWEPPPCSHLRDPDWSWDGAKLAFDYSGVMGADTVSNVIWTINADGSDPSPVPGRPRGSGAQWLPDNRHLVVGPGVRILDTETGEERLACEEVQGFRPGGVSSDGRFLLGDWGFDVHTIDLETCEATNLTNRAGGFDWQPAWRPIPPGP